MSGAAEGLGLLVLLGCSWWGGGESRGKAHSALTGKTKGQPARLAAAAAFQTIRRKMQQTLPALHPGLAGLIKAEAETCDSQRADAAPVAQSPQLRDRPGKSPRAKRGGYTRKRAAAEDFPPALASLPSQPPRRPPCHSVAAGSPQPHCAGALWGPITRTSCTTGDVLRAVFTERRR